jgi:hypothetical protein
MGRLVLGRQFQLSAHEVAEQAAGEVRLAGRQIVANAAGHAKVFYPWEQVYPLEEVRQLGLLILEMGA